jgi:phosphoserine aminotransferase
MSSPGVYFGSGPAMLPREVLSAFHSESMTFDRCQLQFYELSHRHPLSMERQQAIVGLFRQLYSIPDDYQVLFLAGGARHQYEQLLLNYAHKFQFKLLESGHWARTWARTIDRVMPGRLERLPFSCDQLVDNYLVSHSPQDEMVFSVLNETVDGITMPETSMRHPCVVADATSLLGFHPIDVTNYQLMFAQSSKAFGVAGMTLVVVHNQLLDACAPDLMPLQCYRTTASHDSLYSTPPLMCMDVMWHMLKWMQAQGGVATLSQRQDQRAGALYAILDQSSLYRVSVPSAFRSTQNICFNLKAGDHAAFLQSAQDQGLYGLKGHSAVGGVRINLYHGIDDAAFDRLMDFLRSYGKDV